MQVEALQRAYELLHFHVQNAPLGVIEWDEQFRVRRWSGQAGEIFGWREDEVLGRHPAEWPLVHPDDMHQVGESMQALLAGGHERNVSRNRNLHRDGSTLYCEWYNSILRDGDGRALSVFSLVQDVTRRVVDEQALQSAAMVFEHTRDGIMITDADSRIVAVNPAFSQITGYPAEQALGMTPAMLHSGRQGEAFYEQMWATLASVGAWSGEVWNRRRNGEVFPQRLTIDSVRDADGKVSHYVGVFTDITELKDGQERLEHLALYDPLTGLPNRMLFASRLQQAFDAAPRDGHHVAVLNIDLDHFKAINDRLGHAAGDELLVKVAERLTPRLRGRDTLARVGGDEFLVLLDGLTVPRQAANVARDLLQLLKQPFRLADGHDALIGASLGISLCPDDGTTPEQILRNADAAMYQAKELGRDGFQFYTEALTLQAEARLTLERRLRRALRQQQFVLHYQPQLDLLTSRPCGVEALLRWIDPVEGLIVPEHFIEVAEETRLLGPLSDWALAEACRQLALWQASGADIPRVSVNLSARQLSDPELPTRVSAALAESGVAPAGLCLEFPESALAACADTVLPALETLAGLGVTLVIDAYGSDRSSMVLLGHCPISVLKLDRGFVRSIGEAAVSRERDILAAMAAMGNALGLRVVGVGVESQSELEFLAACGVAAWQGYLATEPLPPERLADWLAARGSTAGDAGQAAFVSTTWV